MENVSEYCTLHFTHLEHRSHVCLQLDELNLVVDVSVMLDDLDVHRSDLVAVFQQVLGEHVQEGTSRHLQYSTVQYSTVQ